MGKKPNFKPSRSQKNSVSNVLKMENTQQVVETRKPLVQARTVTPPAQKTVDSRKKKLSHIKILLEYAEKKELTQMLNELGDELGHNVQFSIFARALLLVALAKKDDLIASARNYNNLERPSNSNVQAFRAYEEQISNMIFEGLDLSGLPPERRG